MTFTSNGEDSIDEKDVLSLSTLLTFANIQLVNISLSTNQAAVKNVVIEFSMKFGARVRPGESITVTISDEFFRLDNGDLTCFFVSP